MGTMLRTQSVKEVQEQRQAEFERSQTVSLIEETPQFHYALAAEIDKDWTAAKNDRITIDQELVQCQRDRKGEYSKEELAILSQQNGSDIYLKETAAKIRAGIAHTTNILLPPSGPAYGIEPTPDPEIAPEVQDLILQQILGNPIARDGKGNMMAPEDQMEAMMAMAKQETIAKVKSQGRVRDKEIKDLLEEGGFKDALNDFIEDFFTFPAAFLIGPYTDVKPRLKWERGIGRMKAIPEVSTIQKWRSISPFDAYPGAGADSVDKAPFIERMRFSKADLYRMRKMPGYSESEIREVMEDHTQGRLHNWLWTDVARADIAEHSQFWQKSNSELDGLRWWGSAQGMDLIEWGIDAKLIEDPLDYYDVEAIKVGSRVVMARLNEDPLYRRGVWSACYERIPGSVWGNSIPFLMRPEQRMVNATARALQNNVALSSGPQVELNHERLAPECDENTIYPGKIWPTLESQVSTNGAQAVRFFQPQDNSASLLGTVSYFRQAADTSTGIPAILSGDGSGEGADETARGRSMLVDASAKTLRRAIGNIDRFVIRPTIQMTYERILLSDDAPTGFDDAQVVARGANAILQRENERQSVLATLQIVGSNPVAQQLLGLEGNAKLLQTLFQTMEGVNDVLPEGEALEQLIQTIKATPPPPDPMQIKAEADMKMAQFKAQASAQELAQKLQREDGQMELEKMLKQMELDSQERAAEIQLDKDHQREQTKLKATRMSERERAQIDVALAKMKTEATLRIEVARLKAQREASRQAA